MLQFIFFSLLLWSSSLSYADDNQSVQLSLPEQSMQLQAKVEYPLARQALQQLFDRTLNVALAELDIEGSLFPFAALLNQKRGIELMRWPANQTKPGESEMLGALQYHLKQSGKDSDTVATAYVRNFRVENAGRQQQGILVALDHRDYSVAVFIPYMRNTDGSLELLEPLFEPGINRTFLITN